MTAAVVDQRQHAADRLDVLVAAVADDVEHDDAAARAEALDELAARLS